MECQSTLGKTKKKKHETGSCSMPFPDILAEMLLIKFCHCFFHWSLSNLTPTASNAHSSNEGKE